MHKLQDYLKKTKRLFIVGAALLVAIFMLNNLALAIDTCTDQASGISYFCADSNQGMVDQGGLPTRALAHLENMITQVESKISTMQSTSPFMALGKKIIAVLTMLVIAWGVIKGMVLKPGITQIVADLVFPLVIMALAVASLDQNLGKMIVRSIDTISQGISGTSTSTSSVAFAKNMLKLIIAIWGAPNDFTIITLGLSTLMAGLLKLVAIFFVAAATAVGVATLLFAKFQVALALTLAPVLIPWAIWKPTEFLFSGWLSYLLKGCFMAVGIYSIEAILRSTTGAMIQTVSQVEPGVDSALIYGSVVVMTMLFALLLSKGGDMGAGVIGGTTAGFGGFHAVTSGAAAGASRAVMGAAGAITGAAMGGTAAAAFGRAVAGKNDGQLSELHKAMRPRKGSGRVAYEMGRSASGGNSEAKPQPSNPNRTV